LDLMSEIWTLDSSWIVWSWFSWVFINLLVLIFWIVGALLFGVWWCQDSLLYMPNIDNRKGEKRLLKYNPQGYLSPSEYSLNYEEHYLLTKDNVKIHCWLLLQDPKARSPTVVFFHGNAGNIGFRLPNARNIYYCTGSNVLLVEYRGYGNSQGAPSEQGLKLDAQAAIEFLLNRPDIDSTKIFLFGRSLGGAVALAAAQACPDKIRGIIVENTFTSIDDMVIVLIQKLQLLSKGLKFIRVVLLFFLTNHWSNKRIIGDLSHPILFISGLADELIPPGQMQELHDLASKSRDRRLLRVPDGEHNDTYLRNPDTYYQIFANFIAQNLI